MFDRIRRFFEENPRLPIIVGVALVAGLIAVWGVWGGFSFQIGRFFAAEPPAFAINSAQPLKHGQKLSVSWSATNAKYCYALGWYDISPVTKVEGTAQSDAIDACSTNAKATGNEVGVECCYGGTASNPTDCGSNVRTFSIDKSSCPTAATPTPTTSVTPTPSAACVFKTNFNAPEGAWFCNNLQCQLDGNPSGGQEYPPEGPAVRLNISVYNRSVEQPNPALGPIFVRYILDSTPKCGNGKECYPPKDPLWSCSRPDGKEVDLGRNGSDFYDCYRPIFRVYDGVPTTCCANTGLPGDCFTVTEQVPGGPSPTATTAPTPVPTQTVVPTPTVSPIGEEVICTPPTQTVAFGDTAYFFAFGGDGARFSWDGGPGATQEEDDGTPGAAAFSWTTFGTKVVTVRSAGRSDTCAVLVQESGEGSPTPTPGQTGPVAVVKEARNASTIQTAFREEVTVREGQRVQFRVRVIEREGDGASAMSLSDVVPAGMSYVAGSTTIDGNLSSDGIVSGGLSLPALESGDEHIVIWSAVADRVGLLPRGPQTVRPAATVQLTDDDADSVVSDAVTLTIFGTGTGTVLGGPGGPGQVQVGPSGAIMLALSLAAAASLLYAAHTRSAGFRRREIENVSRQQGPMDFRS